MLSALLLLFSFISILLYSILHLTTPYDDRIDDEQQLLFLRRYPWSS